QAGGGASMVTTYQAAVMAVALATGSAALVPGDASAQTSRRDGIAEILARESQPGASADSKQSQAEDKDIREGSATYEQARRLMRALDAVLEDAARHRSEARKLPSKSDFVVTPLWTETREDRERKIRDLLDAALGIVTDVPV